jgi:outer membrane protein assembly factor BamB
MSTAAVPRSSSRLWFPLLVLIVAPLAGAAVWFWPSDWDHTHRFLTLVPVAGGALVLLACWLLFLSRWPLAVRIIPVSLLVLGSVGFALSVREVHFTGDMWPVFTFRWEVSLDDLLDQDRERQGQAQLPPPEERPVARAVDLSPFESFFGHQRQGDVLGVKLRDDWGARPPREVWRWRIGGGYAGFAVARGRAVTIEQRRDDEVVAAYDVDTGKELWSYRYPTHFKESQGGSGPRATPTIFPLTSEDLQLRDFKVFALGAAGRLTCLDLETGKEDWSADVLANNANLRWGISASPLALGNRRLIVAPGAQTEAAKGRGVIAYDMRTGKERWTTGVHRGAYSSPVGESRGQIRVFDGEGLTGYDEENSKELWHHPWVPMPPEGINVAQPLLLSEDRVFISSGYDLGCAMLQIKEKGGTWTVETLWKNTALRCKFTSPVHRDGYLYGLDEGILTCVDARDGTRRWKGDRYGHGQMLRVDKHLLISSERGDLALVEATPEKYHELGKMHVLDGDKTWNPPALAGNYVFVRNHLWMACYELPADEVINPFGISSTPSD